jgi:hypothetical protein
MTRLDMRQDLSHVELHAMSTIQLLRRMRLSSTEESGLRVETMSTLDYDPARFRLHDT